MRATPEAAGTTRTPALVSQYHLFEPALAAQHMLERAARRQSEQHIDIGQPKIAIEQHGAAPGPAQTRWRD